MFHLLRQTGGEARELSQAIEGLKASLHSCQRCCHLATTPVCGICQDEARETSLVLVVEHPRDVIAFEETERWNGLYHVLMGRVSPHDGAGPGDLSIGRLRQRLEKEPIEEVVLAMGMSAEGDATALAVARALSDAPVKVTRLARGLPSGFTIEYAGTEVLGDALDGRRALPGGE